MSKNHVFREYYEAILVAVIFTLFARTFVAQAFKIPTGSMEDNLLVGDHLFVNKFIYAPHWNTPLDRLLPYRDIRRSDVVVFQYPVDPERDHVRGPAGAPVTVSFTPTLAPMPRGILATCTARAVAGATPGTVRQAWEAAYADEPFVHLLPAGRQPRTGDSNVGTLLLDMNGSAVRIAEQCRTSMRNVWAIGDVTGEPMLAHRAMAQGEMVGSAIVGAIPRSAPRALGVARSRRSRAPRCRIRRCGRGNFRTSFPEACASAA